MRTANLIVSFFLLFGVTITTAYADIQVLDPGYKAELWLSMDASTGFTRDMTFDSNGNLYIASNWSSTIAKITPDKQVNRTWVTSMGNACGMAFTGGTSYGNNLYVASIDNNVVYRIDMNGNKSVFSSIAGATSIEYDRTGTYGGKLYVGTAIQDQIYSVSTSGSASVFCNSFYNLGGNITTLGFGNSSLYNYGMYTGTWYPNNLTKSGIFKVSTSGSAQRICNELTDLVAGYTMGFDEVGLFGGNLFAGIKEDYERKAGIYRIAPDGTATMFIEVNAGSSSFAFSQDGAMYLHDWTANGASIYKITPIPEPTSLALLGLGLILFRKK